VAHSAHRERGFNREARTLSMATLYYLRQCLKT
jgi:hypothetical protein